MSGQTSIGIDLGLANARCAIAHCDGADVHFQYLSSSDGKTTNILSTMTVKKHKREFGLRAMNAIPSNIIADAVRVETRKAPPNAYTLAKTFGEKGRVTRKYMLDTGCADGFVEFSQAEAVAAILRNILKCATKCLGYEPVSAVISVPSFAGCPHRRMLFQAAQIAGIDSARLLNQSTAAAIAYRQNMGKRACGRLGIISMGAGTTECSVFAIQSSRAPELLACDGYVDFGGEQFTEPLVGRAICKMNIQLAKMKREMAKLVLKKIRLTVEDIKMQLAEFDKTNITFELDMLSESEANPRTFDVGRDDIEEICAEEIKKLERLIRAVFCQKCVPERILLAGSASKLYIVSLLLKRHVPSAEIVPMQAMIPDFEVVHGAAIHAAALEAEKKKLSMPSCIEWAPWPDFVYSRIMANWHGGELTVANVGQPLPTRGQGFRLNFYSLWKLIVRLIECVYGDRIEFAQIALSKPTFLCPYVDDCGMLRLMDGHLNAELSFQHHPSVLSEAEMRTARKALCNYEAELTRREEADAHAAHVRELKRKREWTEAAEEEEARKKLAEDAKKQKIKQNARSLEEEEPETGPESSNTYNLRLKKM